MIEVERTMLEEARLPTYFWAEAVSTTCFTQNCTLIDRHGMTPYRMVKGKKPNLKFFHVFGCKCFVIETHLEQLGKFEGVSPKYRRRGVEYDIVLFSIP